MSDRNLGPLWVPKVIPSDEWTLMCLKKYLAGQSFVLYANGTCVVWTESGGIDLAQANRRLREVTTHPDFKVRRHADGNFLVTFRGAVGGLMSGELWQANLASLKEEAFAFGMLPSEQLSADRHDEGEAVDLIVGLYVRARLYRDAEELRVIAVVNGSVPQQNS